jgi:4-hydroxymandelate oxidase
VTSHIVAARRRAFDTPPGPATTVDADLHRYLTDLLTPYGLALRERGLDARRASYATMGETLAGTLAGELAAAPVELVVVAPTVPEVDPRWSAANRLNLVCPGDPLAFALGDQGTAAPFTAISLAREYRRALVLIVEQELRHHDAPPGPAPLPARDRAVALLLGEAGPARLSPVRIHPGVPPERVEEIVAREAAEHFPGTGRVLRAECWWELAGLLDAPERVPGNVLLVGYEPALRYLSLIAVDLS